ncbi:MAG: Asp23/Gls24 family envelope stress response protein [Iamia sp.]
MAETTRKSPSSSSSSSSSSSAVASLESESGSTTIAESVVAKIAAIAAREVEGVDALGGTLSGAIAGVVGRIRGDEHKTAGVGVEVGAKQAAVDLSMTVSYPSSIHEVAEAVRQNVIDRIQSMTGLEVVEVNIAVIDLAFEGGEDENVGRVE